MPQRLLQLLKRGLRSRALKYLIGLVVLAAVGRHVVEVWGQIPPERYDLTSRPGPFLACVGVYVVGLGVFGLYYGRVLGRATATPISAPAAVRAYLISHLGKYVPGKAFVVIIRAGLSARCGADPAAAAFATLYETLLMMASGGFLAAVGFCALPAQPIYALVGLGLGVAFLVTVTPPVFPRICGLAKVPFPGVGAETIPLVSWRLFAEGLLFASIGWVLLGASLAAIVEGLGTRGLLAADLPALIASTAFATVAGFVVAVLPGGLGVREGVLMMTLTPLLGVADATLAALLLRLFWVAGEVLATLALLPWRWAPRPDEP